LVERFHRKARDVAAEPKLHPPVPISTMRTLPSLMSYRPRNGVPADYALQRKRVPDTKAAYTAVKIQGQITQGNSMTSLQALAVSAGISILLSIILLAAISRPLRAFIERVCPGPEAVNFWSRFTAVMLVLSPLFVAVAFGLPSASRLQTLETGEVIQRAVTSSLVGAFLATLGIGLWISSLARRAPPLPPPARNPDAL